MWGSRARCGVVRPWLRASRSAAKSTSAALLQDSRQSAPGPRLPPWRKATMTTCGSGSRRGVDALPTMIADVISEGAVGDTVTLCGWIRHVRRQKRVAFATISDGSGTAIQVGHAMLDYRSYRLSFFAHLRVSFSYVIDVTPRY